MNLKSFFSSRLSRYGISVTSILILTAIFTSLRDHINPTTISLAFLLIVLTSATFFGKDNQ